MESSVKSPTVNRFTEQRSVKRQVFNNRDKRVADLVRSDERKPTANQSGIVWLYPDTGREHDPRRPWAGADPLWVSGGSPYRPLVAKRSANRPPMTGSQASIRARPGRPSTSRAQITTVR